MKLEDALKWIDEINEDDDNVEICPISKEPIKDKITISCGHSFEYYSLFNELIKNNSSTKFHKCPYCRKRTTGFIPYYDIPSMKKCYAVKGKLNNFNNNYLQCQHIFCSGKKKGEQCQKCAHQFENGQYCFTHKDKKPKPKTKPKTDENKSKIKVQCSQILKNGCQCKKYCSKDNDTYCHIHAKMN